MTIKRRIDGAWQTITRLSAYSGNAWRRIKTLKRWDGDEWVLVATFAQPMTVTASSADIAGMEVASRPTRVTSTTTTAIVSGGEGPFSYSWTRIAGDVVSITAPANATTAVAAGLNNEQVNGTIRCTVTDSTGATATTDVDFILIHTN